MACLGKINSNIVERLFVDFAEQMSSTSNLVGTLVYVGKGRHAPEWAAQVLESRDRSRAAPTFEAAGLYLASITYDARWALPVVQPALSVEIHGT